jgi:hypothetical protein
VQAKDAVGNSSPASNIVTVKTLSSFDTTPPSQPVVVAAKTFLVSITQGTLTWLPSTDNVGVEGYVIYLRGAPLLVLSDTALQQATYTEGGQTYISVTVSNLIPNFANQLAIEAYDAPDNRSTQDSAIIDTRLQALGGTATKFPSMQLIGDPACTGRVNNAKQTLFNRLRDQYNLLVSYVGRVDCVQSLPGGVGGLAYPSENPVRVAVPVEIVNADYPWVEGVLVHEATHSHSYHIFRANNPTATHVPCREYADVPGELKSLYPELSVLQQLGAPQYMIDYINNYIRLGEANDPQAWGAGACNGQP